MSNTTDAVMAELIKFRISEDKDADVFEGRWNARRPKAFQVEKRVLEEIKQFVVRGTKQKFPSRVFGRRVRRGYVNLSA